MNANTLPGDGPTIRITLKVFGGLRDLRPSPLEIRTVPVRSRVADLWCALEAEAPEFVAKLRDGVKNGYLHVLVNGRNIVFLDGADTKLNDGDTVAVFPPIGGG